MPKRKSNARPASPTARPGARPARKRQPADRRAIPSHPLHKFKAIKPIANLGKIWDELFKRHPLEFRLSFIRPDDLVVCDFILDNLKLATEGSPKLVRQNPAAPASLIMQLPPQNFGEQAFTDAPALESHRPLPFAKMRMAGPSRIAFAMPADESALDLTADAVLDACRHWPMQLDVNAAPEPAAPGRERFNDRARFNQAWLTEMTGAENWVEATGALTAALGNSDLTRSLEQAAGRIAQEATQSLNTGKTRGMALRLQQNMLGEIDKLARVFPQLRQSETRDIALAALALNSTTVFAASDLKKFDMGAIALLPFLPIVFSPHKPAATVTALELPYRVMLSPVPPSSWWHALQPVTHNGRTELWHTRLTQPADGVGADAPTNVRALWSPDYEISDAEITAIVNGKKPFLMGLNASNRKMLVKLMAGFNEQDADGHAFVPHTARAQRLMLSALGALVDVEGNWTTLPDGVDLEQWRHLSTLGRDFYVRVVKRGFLMPFGHVASLVTVTERKFEDQSGTPGRVALLRQRYFIIVREWVKNYSGTGHAYQGRNFPFQSVEILTHVTPDLMPPAKSTLNDPAIYKVLEDSQCFWPMLSKTQDFMFQLAATDICGNRTTFFMPLLFVSVVANTKPSPSNPIIATVIKDYDATSPACRTAAWGNATICYAPSAPGSQGDPRQPTGSVTFDAAGVTGVSRLKPQFYPEIAGAEVGIAAIQRLLQKPDAIVGVQYPDVYKQFGFGGPNAGELFLKTTQPYGLEFGEQVKNDTLGGLAAPSMSIQGLSRIMGPVAAAPPANPDDIEKALVKVIGNTFDPTTFFKGAKILGGIELADLLQAVSSLAGENVPKLLSKQLPDKIEARFDWKTVIQQSDPAGLFVHSANGKTTTLDMHGVISAPIAQPKATTFNATASLENFKINLFGFIIIWFDRLAFNSQSGSKPDVAVDLHPGDQTVEFGGPLEFVNKLREIIPSNGFADPPSLSITPSGISAGYSLNLPSVGVGIFTLEHVSLGAGFALPFDSKPANVRFNFAERQRPFSLTVSLLGGGGFFAIAVSTHGVDEIEAALEFGAAVAINLGVASGGVEIKAGVYFHWKTKSIELAGYVRLHGELSVLGLISASLTFNLQLAYLKESHHSVVWGEATLTVEIEILFFSFDVSVKCRREFGGSDADPKFIDLIPDQPTWANYCQAFAGEES